MRKYSICLIVAEMYLVGEYSKKSILNVFLVAKRYKGLDVAKEHVESVA
jgi:hypothetical protein